MSCANCLQVRVHCGCELSVSVQVDNLEAKRIVDRVVEEARELALHV